MCMLPRHKFGVLAVAIAMLLPPGVALAQDGLQLGVRAQQESKIYRQQDRELNFYPYVRWQIGRFSVDGDRASYELFRAADGGWKFGPEVRVEFDGYEAKDSPALSGMASRSDPVLVGVSGEAQIGWLELEGFAGYDVRDGGGTILELELGVDGRIATGLFGYAGVGARYANSKYNNHLFGVRAGEATPTRPAYSPGSSTTAFVEFGIEYELSPRWSLQAELEYSRLSQSIRRSPIVDASSRTEAQFGVLYRFY